MNRTKRAVFIISILYANNACADVSLVTYLQHPPLEVFYADKQRINHDRIARTLNTYVTTERPSKIAKTLVKGRLRQNIPPKIPSVFVVYGGYSDYSNNGRIVFPLRHTSPKLYLVITKKIKFEMIKQNTVSHAELMQGPVGILDDPAATQIYLFEKKQDDKHKHYYWDVSEQKKPDDNRINPISMVILTNPRNIYVRTGQFISSENENMVLPPNIYVIGTFENNDVILATMDLKQHLEPVEIKIKVSKTKNQRIIKNS